MVRQDDHERAVGFGFFKQWAHARFQIAAAKKARGAGEVIGAVEYHHSHGTLGSIKGIEGFAIGAVGIGDEAVAVVVAVVVTDPHCTVRVEGPVFAVHQTDAVLAGMDSWNTGTHGRSGLTARVRASTIDEASAEAQVIEFLRQYVPKGKRWKPAILPGFKKAQAHTALADIHESIDELLHYRQHFLAL